MPRTQKAVKLLIQPEDSVSPIVKAIQGAKHSVDILVFRLDRPEVEQALVGAANRGVRVRALIAYTNRGGEKHLRAIESRFLEAGVVVARTADNLIRYHGKMMIVDEKDLYILAFNLTFLDIDHSRSFGVVIQDRDLIQEAQKLFDADCLRKEYSPVLDSFLVSPLNSRALLAKFIGGASKELLIYDPCVSDREMVRLLEEREKAGVSVRVIGEIKRTVSITGMNLAQMRLHTRSIIRDRESLFIGSQSLRASELDTRREIGLILHDKSVAVKVAKVFEKDWELASATTEMIGPSTPAAAKKIAKRVAKAVTNVIPSVSRVLDDVVREMDGEYGDIGIVSEDLQETVTEAVKTAVKEAVRDAVVQAVTPGGHDA
jgi:cardiolipin synthase